MADDPTHQPVTATGVLLKAHSLNAVRAGRKSGTKNKATVDIRAVAQLYTEEAIATLVHVMRDPDQPGAVRVLAADKLLDRGHGKASQRVESDVGPSLAELIRQSMPPRARTLENATTKLPRLSEGDAQAFEIIEEAIGPGGLTEPNQPAKVDD